jgi:luciferase-like monooxygenase
MDSNIVTIEQEVLRWPGVSSVPGRFGAVAFRHGKREIGHIHRDRIADLPVRRELRNDLLLKGRARPHRVGVKGYISYPQYKTRKMSPWCSRSLVGTTIGLRPSPRIAPRVGMSGRNRAEEGGAVSVSAERTTRVPA